MSSLPLISIIIPVYNTEKYLSKCLDSIINQTYKNLEIIIINDGSTDNSFTICGKYAMRDDRINLINKENKGVSSARNQGIDEAKGLYISFVDSDDWIELNTYEVLMNCVLNHNLDAVIFEYFINFENGKELFTSYSNLNGMISKTKAVEITISPVNRFSVSKLYTKEIISDIRYQEEIYYGEDTLFACQALNNADRIYYYATPLYHYLQTATSATRSNFNINKLTSIEAYSRLLELCEKKYPSISLIARAAYISIIINMIIEVLASFDFPNSKAILKKLTQKLRKNLTLQLLIWRIPLKDKFKFLLCYLNPQFYNFAKKIIASNGNE